MNSSYTPTGLCAASVEGLPKDLRRVLKVQFREFIHFVEDAQEDMLHGQLEHFPQYDSREAA